MDTLQKFVDAREAMKGKIAESVGNVMEHTMTKVNAVGGGRATDDEPVLYDIVSAAGAVVQMEYETDSSVEQRLGQFVPVSVVEWRGTRARINAPVVGWISLRDDSGCRMLQRCSEARQKEVGRHFQHMFDKKFNAAKTKAMQGKSSLDPRAAEVFADEERRARRNRRDASSDSDRERKDYSPYSNRKRISGNRNTHRSRRDYSSDSDEGRNTRGSRRNHSPNSDRDSSKKATSGEIPKLQMPSLATHASSQSVQPDLLGDLLDLGSPKVDKVKDHALAEFSQPKPDDAFGDFLGAAPQPVPQGSVQKPVLGLVQNGVQPNMCGQGGWSIGQPGPVSVGMPIGTHGQNNFCMNGQNNSFGGMHGQNNFCMNGQNNSFGGMHGQNNFSMNAFPQPSGCFMGQGLAPPNGQMGQMIGGTPPVYNQMALGVPMTNSAPWIASGGSGMGPGLANQMGA